MLRSPRWAAVLFTLLGAAPAVAGPSDQAQRMPVGPPDPGGPPPAVVPAPVPAPAVVAPSTGPAVSGPVLVPPDYSPPAANFAAPQQPAPAAKTDARGGQPSAPKARRWHLFRRRSNDTGRPSGR